MHSLEHDRTEQTAWRATAWRAGLLLLAGMLLAGCASGGMFSSSKTEGTTSAASGSVPFGDRISSLFGGGSSSAASTPQTPAMPSSEDFDCPRMDIRPGASTLLMNASANEPNALALRYQGTFVRAARECRLQGPNVNIKVGVQGRVILGPAGGPGQLTIPLRVALVQETVNESKVMWSKLYSFPVTVPPDTPNVPFTHVSEDLTIPIPKAAVLDELVIYIGFDPMGAEQERRKPAPKPARRAR
jgi:hypothetical protein